MSKKRAGQTRAFYFSSLVRSFSLIASQSIAVRLMGLDDFGIASFIVSIPLFISTFIGMVFGELTIQLSGNEKAESGNEIFQFYSKLLRREMVYHVIGTLLAGIILVAIAVFEHPVHPLEFAIALMMIPATFGYQTNYNLMLARFRFRQVVQLIWLETFLQFAFIPFALLGPKGYLLMQMLKSLGLGGLSFWLIRPEVGTVNWFASEPPMTLPVLRHQHMSLGVKSIWSTLDMTVLGIFSAPSVVAEYRIVKSLVNLLPTLAQPVWNLAKPKIISDVRTGNWDNVKSRIASTAGMMAIPLGLAVLVCGLLLDPAIHLVYGFVPSSTFKLIFWFSFAATSLATVLTAWSRFLAVLRNQLGMSLMVNVALSLLLVASPFVQWLTTIPIPVTLASGLILASFFWWRWLLAIR